MKVINLNIVAWAWKYFEKSHYHLTQSTAASRNGTWNCITQGGKPWINFVQKWVLCTIELISDGPKHSGKACNVQVRWHVSLFWGKINVDLSVSVMVWGCIKASRHHMTDQHGVHIYHLCTDIYCSVMRDMLCSWHCFPKVCGYFSKTIPAKIVQLYNFAVCKMKEEEIPL